MLFFIYMHSRHVCTCINVYMYQRIHVYMATRTHFHITSFDVFCSDFLDFTILRLISINTLFHNVFHKGTDSETFLVGNSLNLDHKFS